MGVLETIINEGKIREKKRDVSILDETEPKENVDAVRLIESYKNKIDLANQFLELLPMYYDTSGLWWRWKINRWVLTDEVDVLNLVQGSSGANIITSKERNEIVNAIKQAARRKKPISPEKDWLQFNDEIINLSTGERFKATPKYFVTNPIPYDLGKHNETPIMDKIFTEWVGEKYVQTLYEIIAYTLLPDYPLNRLFCFIGAGMNGKSKFLELIRRFVGYENVCSTELDTLIASRFEITRLHKKLICQMGETNFNDNKKINRRGFNRF
jgi:phage/plasmid-associated DNA primase